MEVYMLRTKEGTTHPPCPPEFARIAENVHKEDRGDPNDLVAVVIARAEEEGWIDNWIDRMIDTRWLWTRKHKPPTHSVVMLIIARY